MGEGLEKCEDDIKQLSENFLTEKFKGSIPKAKHKCRKTLTGHFGNVCSMQWSPHDSKHLVSASQDGKLIIWEAFSAEKCELIPLESSWVMCCGYATSGKYVASGGLDNTCSIFKLNFVENPTDVIHSGKPLQELRHHDGYISCCRFIDDDQIITASGDTEIVLWDVESGKPNIVYKSHTADVMCVSLCADTNTFVSGSVDCTSKLFDLRTDECVATLEGHGSDVNAVDVFPDGIGFCTGSDDSTCRTFDLRTNEEVMCYASDTLVCGVTSIALLGGHRRLLVATYESVDSCYIWDTVSGKKLKHLKGHDNRVSCVGSNGTGEALCTGSWDKKLRIWS